jgi:hypothetical protein
MRKAIRQRLIDKIPEVAGRVYEPYMAGPSTKKPYIVLKYGGDIATGMRYGFEVPFEVWLYCERTTFKELDVLESKAIRALLGVDLVSSSDQTFSLKYNGSSSDFYDEDWKALTRQLDFRTNRIRGG